MEQYDPHAFPPFAVTVDLAVLTLRDGDVSVLLVQRKAPPFAGQLALPGGFVAEDRDLADAAQEKLAAKTGLAITATHLEQLGTFGSPGRDPRMRVVSVAYLAFADAEPPGSSASWVPVEEAIASDLAFDHSQILDAALERTRSKLEYTTLATRFCPAEFTIADLRTVYELVWNTSLDPANFHRKVMATKGFVTETGHTVSRGKGRPARLYRPGGAEVLSPPLTR